MGLLLGRGSGQQRAAGGLWGITSPQDLISPRPFWRPGAPFVSNDSAMRHSAVWACLRLRADLISTLPLDIYRRVAGIQVECPKPEVLRNPAGPTQQPGDGYADWMYSSQLDLDRSGNTVGLITARDGLGLPARVELAPASETSVVVKGGVLTWYRINGKLYDPKDIWHERSHPVSGFPLGLSPVAYAAYTIGQAMSIQEFATNWFGTGSVPRARLSNKAKTINPLEASIVKESWRASLQSNEPFVHGSDWEYAMIQAEHASTDWLDGQKFSITDTARFFGVPADLIDSGETGVTGKVTYQNITQRNMQFLVMQLGPAIIRREIALSALTPKPRYVKLNTKAFLRLDPLSQAEMLQSKILSRTLTPTEARELDDLPPLTQAQIAELDHFWPPGGAVKPPTVPGAVKPGELPPQNEPAAVEPGAS